MFGLLKKNDFDAESILIQSRIAELSTAVNKSNNIHDMNIKVINNCLQTLTERVSSIHTQLNNIQNTFIQLQKNIEILNTSNKILSVNDKKVNNLIPNKINNFRIDFEKLIDFIADLYKDKHSLVGSSRRILENQEKNGVIPLETEIRNYLSSQQNINCLETKQYPNLNLYNFNDFNPESDILLSDNSNNIHTIIELKRWDSEINLKDLPKIKKCSAIEGDRALHYADINKLFLSKKQNKNIKHYFISIYENYDDINALKGYVAKFDNDSIDAGYGPFNKKQLMSNVIDKKFIDITKIIQKLKFLQKEKIKNLKLLNDNILKIEKSFLDMYNAEGIFTFDYIDFEKVDKGDINFFSQGNCQVIYDKQINNTNLNQEQINNLSLQKIVDLPSNWRVRILEVL